MYSLSCSIAHDIMLLIRCGLAASFVLLFVKYAYFIAKFRWNVHSTFSERDKIANQFVLCNIDDTSLHNNKYVRLHQWFEFRENHQSSTTYSTQPSVTTTDEVDCHHFQLRLHHLQQNWTYWPYLTTLSNYYITVVYSAISVKLNVCIVIFFRVRKLELSIFMSGVISWI